MPFYLLFYVAAAIIAATTTAVIYRRRIQLIKADMFAELIDQSTTSYRLGWFRGMQDEMELHRHRSDPEKTALILVK